MKKKEFDNKERSRYYGIRKGDTVKYKSPNNQPKTEGVVIDYGFMDNNCVVVKFKDYINPVFVVAEWLDIVKKVEEKETI